MRNKTVVSPDVNDLSSVIVDAAFKIHTTLGPGLLESVYEACMEYELNKRGCSVERKISMPISYDDLRLDAGLRLDLLVDNKIIVEIKAVERLLPVHDAQLLTYLKLAAKPLGLLINFNVPVIKDGIRRRVPTTTRS